MKCEFYLLYIIVYVIKLEENRSKLYRKCQMAFLLHNLTIFIIII